MKRLLDRVLFCLAYKVVHQPFFGLKISSQVLNAFAIHCDKERNCLETSGWLFFEPFRLCIWAPHRGGVFKLGSNNAFEVIILMWVSKFMLVDISKPRYLAADTLFRVWLCIVDEVSGKPSPQ